MALKKKAKAEVAPEVAQEEVKTEPKVDLQAKIDEVPEVPVEAPVVYIDPTDHVYELKAGKTFSGLSYDDVMNVVDGLLGKVETITIKRKA